MSSQSDKIRTEILVLRCQRGDAEAFRELIALWEKPLYYYIRRLVPTEEDAFDSLQEVWMKVFSKARQIRDPGLAVVWLYRIARNTAYNSWRGKMKTEPLDDAVEDVADEEPDVSQDLVSAEDAEAVHRALAKLPMNQREALTLFFLEDLSLKEIGEVTGVSVGTVKSRLHHGKSKLREILREEDFSHV